MSKIIVGIVNGEQWVSTNDGGVGRTLFKLQDSEELLERNEKLNEALKAALDYIWVSVGDPDVNEQTWKAYNALMELKPRGLIK